MTYKTILMDPPWAEVGGGKIKRGADRHYPVMTKEGIIETVLSCPLWRPENDSHLWVWVTSNRLVQGLWLMERLGFRYVTNAAWVKQSIGLGQYLRHQHELILLGVRGRLPYRSRSTPSVIHAPRTVHSAKPPESYDMIEAVSHPAYAEIFARRSRPGWDVWGNQVDADPVDERQATLFGGCND